MVATNSNNVIFVILNLMNTKKISNHFTQQSCHILIHLHIQQKSRQILGAVTTVK